MSKEQTRRNVRLLLKAGLPYTCAGMVIVFVGIYVLKHFFAHSSYLTAILFLWLAAFWLVYQPLFRKRIQSVSGRISEHKAPHRAG